jgi:hypothetical protein
LGTVSVELKKKADGTAILTFVRADGSRTSSPIGAALGFGPVHDLAHYAVESVLGIARGFIGLCGEGWAIEDFDKGAAKSIPPEAGIAEVVAGEISRMEITGQWLSLEDFHWTVAASGFTMTADDFDAIRRLLAALRAQWSSVAPGGTMTLQFEPGRIIHTRNDGTTGE